MCNTGGAGGDGADEVVGDGGESGGDSDLFRLEGGMDFAGEDAGSGDGLTWKRGQDGDVERGWRGGITVKVIGVDAEDMAARGRVGPDIIGHDELGGDAVHGVRLAGQERWNRGVVPGGFGRGEQMSIGEEINFYCFAGAHRQGGIHIGMNEKRGREGNVGIVGQNAAVEEDAHGNIERRFGDALRAGSGQESRDEEEQG